MPGSSRVMCASVVVRRRETAAMQYSSVPDVGKPLSELAIGCMGFRTMPDAQAVYDTFFEEGGTVFDTAHIYLKGLADELLGHWIASHGLREDLVVIGKGAHPPNRYPETIERDPDEKSDKR